MINILIYTYTDTGPMDLEDARPMAFMDSLLPSLASISLQPLLGTDTINTVPVRKTATVCVYVQQALSQVIYINEEVFKPPSAHIYFMSIIQ